MLKKCPTILTHEHVHLCCVQCSCVRSNDAGRIVGGTRKSYPTGARKPVAWACSALFT